VERDYAGGVWARADVADAARLLAKASSEPVTEAMIRGDIDDGAPTNPDGTVNLVHYAAWLAMKTREDAGG
jgi:hypothetical protein